MANLRVIVRNDQPKREENCPRTWLLYKEKETIEIHITARQPQLSFRAR
jgi:hypothetical protein